MAGDPTSSRSGAQSVTVVTVPISAAQIITLNTVPVELVAAPGASKILVPLSATALFTPGVTQFTGGNAAEALRILNGPSGDAWLEADGADNVTVNNVIKGTTSMVIPFGILLSSNQTGHYDDVVAEFVNVALRLRASGSNYATGDGTMQINLAYYTATFA